MREQHFRDDAGIAIGPILFVIAVLAILASAIAAGIGSLTGGATMETATLMAQTILNQGSEEQWNRKGS